MKESKIKELIAKMRDLSETRIYYPGDEPWAAIREIMAELADFLEFEYSTKK